jgi:murein endopeptidase
VGRVCVNAAIKKALCREAGSDRAWLEKVRPWWGHDYHFHVRLRCPGDSPECKPQPPAPGGDGRGKDLNYWFSRERRAERGTERVPKEVQRHAKLVVLDTIGVILVGASRPDAPPQCALDRKKP